MTACRKQEVLTPEQLLDPIERIPGCQAIANTGNAGTKNVSSFVAQTAPEHPVSRSQFHLCRKTSAA